MSNVSTDHSSPGSCIRCMSTEKLFVFCCLHNFCTNCVVLYCFRALQSAESRLKLDINSLANKASYLGCPLQCQVSSLSLSLRTVNEFAQHCEKLSTSEKLMFSDLTNLFCSFFCGFKTNFYRCFNCEQLRADTKSAHVLCEICIKNIISSQNCSREIKCIKYTYEFSIESLQEIEYFKELFVVQFDKINNTYVFHHHSERECIIIPKVVNFVDSEEVMIVRAITTINTDEYIAIESNNHHLIQIVNKVCIKFRN